MNSINKKSKRNKTTFLAIFLFLLGLGFLAIEPVQNFLVQRQSTQVLMSDIGQNVSAQEGDFDFESVEEVSLQDVIQAQFSDQNLAAIGSIAIPDVGLHLPILNGVSNANLLAGAGTMKPNQVMGEGNYALASHNMKNPTLLFAPLHRAEPGMTVYLTDAKNFYVYEIVTHQIIEPTAVSVIEDTDETLVTLITCNVDGNKRLLTQGKFIESVPVDESEEIAAYFEMN